MKHIFYIILIITFSIYSAFAETTIDFSSDKKNYNIEDTINLNITVQTDNTGETGLTIEGIDDFKIVRKRQSQSRSSINGKGSSTFILNLSLLAKKAGEYTLGPIITGSGTGAIQSETIEIKITGERIMVNPQFNNSQANSQDDEEEQNIDDINLNTSSNTNNSGTEIEIIPKKILGIDGEEMLDIYRNDGFLYSFALIKKILTILSLLLLAIIGFILGRKYFESRAEELVEKPIELIEEKIEINYEKLLYTLKKNYLDATKEVFYAQTGEVYRTYLDDKIQEGLSKGSLNEVGKYFSKSEIDSDTSTQLLNFYKKIYFPEYNTVKDNIDERKNILEELEKIIIVKEFK